MRIKSEPSMEVTNGYENDSSLSPNSLLSTFETAIDEELNLAFTQMVDSNDPWIGNGICDNINMFNHDMFDDEFCTESSKSSNDDSLSPQPVNIKCEVEIDNEVEINSSEDIVDSPLSYECSSHSSSPQHSYDYPQVVLLSAQTHIKKEPKESKSSPKTSPKTRTPRSKQITDLVLTDEEKRLLNKEGYHDFPCGNLPLTKHEEKILRKIRRKIRNKKSAQCSRQRKKEYLEDLEKRFDERNHENDMLKKEVIKLKKENDTLMMKMKKLLTMNGQANASFKSSFFVIILSFLLILVPYFRPDVEENLGLSEKTSGGTGRHLLMALYSSDFSSNAIDSNETILNFTSALSNSSLI